MLTVFVEQSYGFFTREPSTELAIVLPTGSTLTSLEPGEHVKTSYGITLSHNIFFIEVCLFVDYDL